MVYCTKYELMCFDYKSRDLIDDETNSKIEEYLEQRDLMHCFENSCKWYDHDQDMLVMSKKFSYVLFALNGYGEDPGDLWKTYYLNGKKQEIRAVITYPSFDVNLLT